MALYAWPAALRVQTFALSPEAAVIAHGGELGDSEQVVDRLRDRWMASLSIAPWGKESEARAREAAAFLARLRSGVNTVRMHNRQQPIPRGSLRGSPTFAATAQGAATIVLNCASGATLKAFDCIGVGAAGSGSQLFMVAEDCAESGGTITVPIVNRVRAAISAGVAAVWDRPEIAMRVVGNPRVSFLPGVAECPALELVEALA